IEDWNVNGLNVGKLDIVKREMNRLNIYILGISEIHWTGNGFFNSGEHTVYYSGNDTTRRRGVGFTGKPHDVTVLQIYSPTAVAPEEEVEEFYGKLQDALSQIPNKDIIYIIGDFNSKVGTMAEPEIVGRFGLGVRNEAGDRLVQFCQEHRLMITNTWFEQPKWRLYTWTLPSGEHRNQIDYILCQKKWQSSILAVKTYPGVACGSDHQLLVATVKLKFCNTKQTVAAKKFNTEKISPSYAVEVKNRFNLLTTEERHPDELWEEVKACIIETALEHVPYKKPSKSAQWISDLTISIAEERRKAKATGNREDFRRLNAEFQREAREDKENYWNEQCQKMEEASRKGHTRKLYAHVKRAWSTFKARKATIHGSNGQELHDQQAIRDRWKEYTEKLYERMIIEYQSL
ncbi:CFDP2 protein, partial [Polyodon spathula]|nr:CFDP2 protein [Polyodon spathula]